MLIAIIRKSGTVIDFLIAQCGDRDRFLRYDQFTVFVFNVVTPGNVVTVSIRDHRFGRDVAGSADIRLAAFNTDRLNAVTIRQVRTGIAVVREGCAVIDLLIAVCGDDHGFRCHGQMTGHVGNSVTGCYILTFGIFDQSGGRDIIFRTDLSDVAGDNYRDQDIARDQRCGGVPVVD